MKKLKITESVCELSTTTELDVVAIVVKEGNIITIVEYMGRISKRFTDLIFATSSS